MKKEIRCSFCGVLESEADMIINGEGAAYICNLCIDSASKIIHQSLHVGFPNFSENLQSNNAANEQTPPSQFKFSIISPKEIKSKLDEYVIGQDAAKKALSVAVYNHYKRIKNLNPEDNVVIEKSNILMIGDTGTGKTYLAKTLAKIIDVPFCIVDATVLTEAGYVGEDVESILTRLLQAANYDVEAASKGIVFVDEIDKISRKGDNPSITRDVSGEGVQQGLLKLLEGSKVKVAPQGGRKHPEQKMIEIDTENILFICGGAFDGIDKIIAKRMKTNPIGFTIQTENSKSLHDIKSFLKYVASEDVKKFGLIPELLGRLPIISHLDSLTKDALKSILLEPKNALIRQYKKLFEMDAIELEVKDDALNLIVDEAYKLKLGARGLRSICEKIFLDYMFDSSDKIIGNKLIITKEVVLEKGNLDDIKSV